MNLWQILKNPSPMLCCRKKGKQVRTHENAGRICWAWIADEYYCG